MRRRSGPARFGLGLLGMLAPGLGLIRAGHLRIGYALFLGWWLVYLAMIAITFAVPAFSYPVLAVLAIGGAAGIAMVGSGVVLAIVRSFEKRDLRVWSSWPVIIAIVVVTFAALLVLPTARGPFRSLYIPSESMLPLLGPKDHWVADTRRRSPARGDVVLYRVREHEWVKRIVGLPGDVVALDGGVVTINGVAVPQTAAGTLTGERGKPATVLLERLPGEAAPHAILDLGMQRADDFAAVRVPEGHIFLLGDNRDNSADSRFAQDQGGSGMVPVADVVGMMDFLYWPGVAGKQGGKIADVQANSLTIGKP